ncbi:hypothetical protein TIFTF001_012611 [Ficus carica]|uniref:Uncharacterized protein n=1 Tax=Ficus carica TaxID=3494 RepID=A0AA88ACM4_FICCA|nr:hypothetical protein TIFTF001_012611 [Ficus carica]
MFLCISCRQCDLVKAFPRNRGGDGCRKSAATLRVSATTLSRVRNSSPVLVLASGVLKSQA